VSALAGGKVEFALLAVVMNDEATGFLAHLERLHQVNHAHLFEAALNDAGTRSALLQFFEMQAVDHLFVDSNKVLHEEWFGDEIFDTVHEWAKAFFDVGAAGHEQKGNVPRLLAASQFFKKLAAVEPMHFVVAKDSIGRVVNNFEQSVGAIRRDHDV